MSRSGFSTEQLVKLAGLPSKHMVAYLCRSGVLTPSLSKIRRRGVPRQFAFEDIVVARVVANLLRSGVSVSAVRIALRTLAKQLRQPASTLRSQNVAIVGKRVYISESPEMVTELTAGGQLAFCFMLDLPNLFTETQRQIRQSDAA